jgi:hypothetical protein
MRRNLDRCVACRVILNRERRRRIFQAEQYKAMAAAVNQGFMDLQAGLMLTGKPRAQA